MSRKSMVFKAFVMLILVFAGLVPASADPPPPFSQPGDIFIVAPDPQYELSAGDDVRFIAVWSVCRAPGLVQAFHSVGIIELSVDGQELLGSRQDNAPYWWDTEIATTDDPLCNNHSDTVYIGWWVYGYGMMSPGTHVVEATIDFRHAITDLYDAWPAGPDGRPDLYPSSSFTVSTTVVIRDS